MPFEAPNYTQTPNDLFDVMLPDMGYAELKVTLAAIRITLGWHRERARLSLRKMMEMTGLSRPAVIQGAKEAENRGTIECLSDGKETEWVVKILDQGGKATLPHAVKELYHPIPLKKEIKKRKRKEGASAPPAISAFREIAHAYPSKAQWPAIVEAVGDDPDNIALWRSVVGGYILLGWNPRNVAGMLDYYRRREVPQTRRPVTATKSDNIAEALRILGVEDGHQG